MKDRTNQILEILAKNEKADVAYLSSELNVSQVTIRKDLDKLEQSGIVRRQHGYALLSTTNDIYVRLAYHYDIKLQIAKKAAEMVKENETIMIESGSCCALLAKQLALKNKNITIITNSSFIADYIRKIAEFNIILLGGYYQKDSQAMVGPLVSESVRNFYVDKFFIGIDGYSTKTGFTNHDQLRAQAVRDMSKQADRVIILTESEKFNTHCTVPINITEKVSDIITDSKINQISIKELSDSNIKINIIY